MRSWIGDILIGQLGHKIADYNVIPAVIGALVRIVIIDVLDRRAKIV